MENPIFRFAVRDNLEVETFLPKRGTEYATGWDVRAAINSLKMVLRPGKYVKIPLGFRVLAPPGWWLELRPRSSTFGKKQLHCLYGVIDQDYAGECLLACQYIPDIEAMGKDLVIEFGEAIGQIVPVKRQEMTVQAISNSDYDTEYNKMNYKRGAGGFGSTGR